MNHHFLLLPPFLDVQPMDAAHRTWIPQESVKCSHREHSRGTIMHRNVRALSRGLALIAELNAAGPSNVVQLANRTGLNRTTCYRLLETLRDDGYVTFDEMNALFGPRRRFRQ